MSQSREMVAHVSPSVAGQVKLHSRLWSRLASATDEPTATTVRARLRYEVFHIVKKRCLMAMPSLEVTDTSHMKLRTTSSAKF
jgi:hypothetical protein